MIRTLKRVSFSCALVLPLGLWAASAIADPETTPPQAEAKAPAPASSGIHIELNKLEPSEKGCRAYMVLDNPGETTYQSFKIDLVLFQTDGVIGKRFSIDLAPLKPKKKTVKLFEIDSIHCDKIGSFLINDVMECKADGAAASGCLDKAKTSSLTNAQLSK